MSNKKTLERKALLCTLFTLIFIVFGLGLGFGIGLQYMNSYYQNNTNFSEINVDISKTDYQKTVSGTITTINDSDMVISYENKEITIKFDENTKFSLLEIPSFLNVNESSLDSINKTDLQINDQVTIVAQDLFDPTSVSMLQASSINKVINNLNNN